MTMLTLGAKIEITGSCRLGKPIHIGQDVDLVLGCIAFKIETLKYGDNRDLFGFNINFILAYAPVFPLCTNPPELV
jgi:hypothetical protein